MASKRDYGAAYNYFLMGENDPKDQLVMAQIFAIQGHLSGADSMYTSILARDSTSSSAKVAMNEQGKLRFRQKDYAGALASFQRRIALDPNSSEAYFYMGLSQKELKRFPEALESLKKSTALDTTKADRFFWQGVLSDQQKNIPEAVKWYRKAAEAGIVEAQVNLGMLFAKGEGIPQSYSEALNWFRRAAEQEEVNAQYIDAYRKALALDPNQPEASKGIKILSGAVTSSKGG